MDAQDKWEGKLKLSFFNSYITHLWVNKERKKYIKIPYLVGSNVP